MKGVIIRFVKNCKLSDRSKEGICCLYCFVALGDARNLISDGKSKYSQVIGMPQRSNQVRKRILPFIYYKYNPCDFKYRVRHPLFVTRWLHIRWINRDKWYLGGQSVLLGLNIIGFHLVRQEMQACRPCSQKQYHSSLDRFVQQEMLFYVSLDESVLQEMLL